MRNRFRIGASKVFNKHFTQDFYYLRQNDGVSVPGDLNVIGTILEALDYEAHKAPRRHKSSGLVEVS